MLLPHIATKDFSLRNSFKAEDIAMAMASRLGAMEANKAVGGGDCVWRFEDLRLFGYKEIYICLRFEFLIA